MLRIISGKWVFKDDEQFFRVRYVDASGKTGVVYALGAFSHDIKRAFALNGVRYAA